MSSGLGQVAPAAVFARPTADEIWLGPTQMSALSQLRNSAPVVLLCGRPSSGRTTLLARFEHELSASAGATPLRLAPAERTEGTVLGSLLEQLGISAAALGVFDRRNLLTMAVTECRQAGARIVVLIDDADRLSASAQAEIERLTSLSFRGEPALEWRLGVRVGELPWPETNARTANPATITLTPLSNDEIPDYVAWRLARHGLGPLFTATALRLIGRYSAGSFRAVDTLCRMSLLLLARAGQARVDVRLVDEATRILALNRVRRRHAKSEVARQDSSGNAAGTVAHGWLTISLDSALLGRFPISDRMLIGCDDSNDIRLDGESVSRHHMLIRADSGGIRICDLKSSKGVVLNGARVDAALLRDSDVIMIGGYRIEVDLPAGRSQPAQQDRGEAGEALPDTIVMPLTGSPRHLRVVR